MNNLKECTKCRVAKSIEEFHKDKTKMDGRRYWCKDCCSSRQRNYRQPKGLREYHGGKSRESNPRLCETYGIWTGMKQRCQNENHPSFLDYGGRGIKVCERWSSSFKTFLEDMGERPEGLSIDRINNDGNYEPSNCRWTDAITQSNNRRNTR